MVLFRRSQEKIILIKASHNNPVRNIKVKKVMVSNNEKSEISSDVSNGAQIIVPGINFPMKS